ncbi:class I lanthipeptide [Flavobacterium sp.]|uniref:class I lanthipeptide n=1 Tax=Flavobacterium sp. TaxID=239 RepID=UPI0031D6CD81
MKNQNPKNKLAFNKASVTELNNNQLETVNGGTSSATTVGTTSLVLITLLTAQAE